MSMSKKDFVALADALRPALGSVRSWHSHDPHECEGCMLDALLSFCRQSNPRFDADLWLSYLRGECGPNGGKR